MRKRELEKQVAAARLELLQALPATEVVDVAHFSLEQLARLVGGKLMDARRIWRDVNVGLGTIQGLVSDVRDTHKDEQKW